jgi:uncharacterized protein (DUF2336 family)
MFLFTTPAEPRASAPATPVVDAIRQGAEQTGTDFEYLLSTAKRESALDPTAKAPTSSATGLFQFIEQTWLGLMKTEGAKLGLSDLSAAITARGDGTYAVGDGAARDAILKLREEPRLASMMAGTLTQQNRDALLPVTGREPTGGELYMAHLLGARGASDLIRAAKESPDRAVASDMPEAAAANRSIFFDRTGKARSASELYAALSTGAPAAVTASPAAPAAPRTITATGQPAVTRTGDGPPMLGLFRNEARTGPVSDAGREAVAGEPAGGEGGRTGHGLLPEGRRDPERRRARAAGHRRFGARCPLAGNGFHRRDGCSCAPAARRQRPASAAAPARPPAGRHLGGTRTPRQHRHLQMIVRRFLLWAREATPGHRAEATAALAKAYLYAELSEADRWEAETALTAMLDDPAPIVRRAMAESLAASADAPRHIVIALAADVTDVAELVLARSPVLIDADLVDAAALGDERVQRAIAARPRLSASVSAALGEIGRPAALVAMASNPGAEIGHATLSRILERHGDHALLREALLGRPDLPVDIAQAIAAAIARSLEKFVIGCGWLSPERSGRVAREARERTTVALSAGSERSDVERLVAHLRATDQLTPALMLAGDPVRGHGLRAGGVLRADRALAEAGRRLLPRRRRARLPRHVRKGGSAADLAAGVRGRSAGLARGDRPPRRRPALARRRRARACGLLQPPGRPGRATGRPAAPIRGRGRPGRSPADRGRTGRRRGAGHRHAPRAREAARGAGAAGLLRRLTGPQ